MITLRKSKERGFFDHGWLKTHHTFSFADYRDSDHTQYQSLRVINEDFIAGSKGFGTHAHRDMEIITYIISGSLEHKDSMGNGSVIKAGDVQYMSAGSGVEHSEFNPSAEAVHLLQIWVFPNAKGLKPSYDQKHFDRQSKTNQLRLLVTGQTNPELISINQDVQLFASILETGKTLKHQLAKGRYGWVQLISGKLKINDVELARGDGAAISEVETLSFLAGNTAEFLLFDLG